MKETILYIAVACILLFKLNHGCHKQARFHYFFKMEHFSAVKFGLGYKWEKKYEPSCDTKISKSLKKKLKNWTGLLKRDFQLPSRVSKVLWIWTLMEYQCGWCCHMTESRRPKLKGNYASPEPTVIQSKASRLNLPCPEFHRIFNAPIRLVSHICTQKLYKSFHFWHASSYLLDEQEMVCWKFTWRFLNEIHHLRSGVSSSSLL